MYGFKIQINCLPEICWASETTVTNYQWKNRNSRDMLEISYTSFDSKTVILDGKERILKNHALSCVVGDEPRESFCVSDAPVNIISVAVRLRDFRAVTCQIAGEDRTDPAWLLLPGVLEALSPEDALEVTAMLHRLIRCNADPSESGKTMLVSVFFGLLAKIDAMVRNDAESVSRHDFYIRQANAILARQYGEKITLAQVAEVLHITPVYLSAIYKKFTGMTFSEHLLNIRMQQADKLLVDQNIPTAKVAALLGFCDENYFRKKFKQFFGMNVREYRNIKSGLTLYHKKPQREKNQDD